MLPQTFTINQFSITYKLGRTKTYEEIENGRLVTYKVGRNRYISVHAAEDWQRRLEAETLGTSTSVEAL